MSYQFHPSILRAYDVRGVVGETLSSEDAYYLGRLFASRIQEEAGRCRICVGFDGRVSSPAFESELVRGLMASGAEVIRIGIGPSPMLYYAVRVLQADGGVMITGSHNPANHNGLKFTRATKPFFGDDILAFQTQLREGQFHNASGSVTFEEVMESYVESLAQVLGGRDLPFSVAWDPGNGAAGEIIEHLIEQLPGGHVAINTVIDGTFPSHHPDPTVAENLAQLIDTVKESHCQIGLAFDGDGDRIGAVDDQGRILWGDQLVLLLAQDLLKKHPGATIIGDVKCSQIVFDGIAQAGGKPVISQTGHSLIKQKMQEESALFAGEMSGHLFFADEYYGFDDGIYAGMRLLRTIIDSGVSFSELVNRIPQTFSTLEHRLPCERKQADSLVELAKKKYANKVGHALLDIDGIRVTTPEGWWLIRASNTQPVIVWRAEGTSPEGLIRLEEEVQELLSELKE